QNVEVVCADYHNSMNFIDKNTFVYIDPPYRPLSQTAAFTSYTTDEFGDKEQIELSVFIDEISAKGARMLLSNSDPKNTNIDDDFFDRLYSKHDIDRISAARAINSVGSSRKKISELLISGR
ncbi:MAG: DNA adenine methylase, partial [Oscillospiraceae bacterium]|nr:DNA adenine methylase [Oscillospiraceae bacterium]